jgi:hypothetical protein
MTLRAIPLTRDAAQAWVRQHHRHSIPPVGCKWAVGVEQDGRLCGVVIAGRPVARLLDDGRTLEVLRVCTDGTRNACSFLYGTAKRIAAAMGYGRVITYTLASECGASLRAVGARPVATVPAREWDTPKRRRASQPVYSEDKIRWEL